MVFFLEAALEGMPQPKITMSFDKTNDKNSKFLLFYPKAQTLIAM